MLSAILGKTSRSNNLTSIQATGRKGALGQVAFSRVYRTKAYAERARGLSSALDAERERRLVGRVDSQDAQLEQRPVGESSHELGAKRPAVPSNSHNGSINLV
ncbi:hypothetical protein UVI_02015250 [Ustilaginoidea virens]|uniref:Uncharacterized protein n=1 Tax=Ustilaginoidea virens TaxID=1159556 RepID=A0A1B5KT13_USTVR|nr:hypothetical protein UVI_02015250 [Ustilaginoidea virens]